MKIALLVSSLFLLGLRNKMVFKAPRELGFAFAPAISA